MIEMQPSTDYSALLQQKHTYNIILDVATNLNSACPPLDPDVKFPFIFPIDILRNPYFKSLKHQWRLFSYRVTPDHSAIIFKQIKEGLLVRAYLLTKIFHLNCSQYIFCTVLLTYFSVWLVKHVYTCIHVCILQLMIIQ